MDAGLPWAAACAERQVDEVLGGLQVWPERATSVTSIPRNRMRYVLTPQGFTEKSRLTYLYMQYSPLLLP